MAAAIDTLAAYEMDLRPIRRNNCRIGIRRYVSIAILDAKEFIKFFYDFLFIWNAYAGRNTYSDMCADGLRAKQKQQKLN